MPESNPTKILEVLTSPEKWCKKHIAENKDGLSVPTDSSTACRWCLVGAAYVAYGHDARGEDKVWEIIRKAQRHLRLEGAMPGEDISLSRWNDLSETTFDDVQALCAELGI